MLGALILQRYLRCNNTLHLSENAFIAFGLTADKNPGTLALRPILLVADKAQNASLDSPKCHHSQILFLAFSRSVVTADTTIAYACRQNLSSVVVLNPDEKRNLFRDVGGILKSSGKFQIIDMAADSEESKRLYNLYHSRKTKEAYRQCWIPTCQEYYELFAESGFDNIKEDSYVSHVNTIDWFNEGQITEERLHLLNGIFRNEIDKGGHAKEYFNLRETKDGNILVDFPVFLICGEKSLG